MANSENIALGPAQVTISGSFGGQVFEDFDLGLATDDGVTITLTAPTIEVTSDRSGTEPEKIFSTGQSATIATPLLEERFETFFLAQAGTVSGTGNVAKFGRSAGFDQTNNWSGRMIVKPLDPTRPQYEFFKVTPTGDKSLTFNSAGATVINVEWQALADRTLPDGEQLGIRKPQS